MKAIPSKFTRIVDMAAPLLFKTTGEPLAMNESLCGADQTPSFVSVNLVVKYHYSLIPVYC